MMWKASPKHRRGRIFLPAHSPRQSWRREWRVVLFFISCLCLVSACVARVDRPPDLGAVSSYPHHFSAEDLEIGIEFPENINQQYDNNVRVFNNIGMLALNLKVENKSRRDYIIQRDNISLILSGGAQYKPLDLDEILELASGLFGLPVYLPGIGAGYNRWGIRKTTIVRPGESVEGYLFFRVEERYDQVRASSLQFSPVLATIGDSLHYEFPIGAAE